MPTTAWAYTAKQELMEAGHCTLVTQSGLAGAGASGAFTLTGLASTAGVAVGAAATGTNVGTGAIVSSIDSATQVHVSVANAGTVTSGTIAFTADVFKMSLIKVGFTGTYDGTLQNAGTPNSSTGGTPSTTNIGTDEIAASGSYPSGGVTLTNVSPILSGTSVAVGSFGNVSITSATISTVGGVIYNTNARVGASTYALSANRVVSVHDFGGTQTVTNGTMTLTIPTQNSTQGLLRIS